MQCVSHPVDTYKTNTQSETGQFLRQVRQLMIDKRRNKNTPNSVCIPITFVPLEAINIAGLQDDLGFYYTSFITSVIPLPKTKTYKINNISEIILSINIFCVPPDLAAGFFASPSTDFSIDFYLSLVLVPQVDGNIFSQFANGIFLQNRLMTIQFTFSFTTAEPTFFTVTAPSREYQLSDTIAGRENDTGSPDFTSDPTKIQQRQYEQLITSDNILLATLGYDNAQYLALSAGNKSFFDVMFKDGGAGSPPYFAVGIHGSLTYFGMQANFNPIQKI